MILNADSAARHWCRGTWDVAWTQPGWPEATGWPIASESVDMIFNSPPFWQQRKYGKGPELGREPTLEAWVEAQVAVFREARRALKPWGTLWVELGDKRSSNGGGASGAGARGAEYMRRNGMDSSKRGLMAGAKEGELCGTPAAFARAMSADGWYLRSEIIWHKPDASPETLRGWSWERCRVKVKSGWAPGECPKGSKRGDVARSGEFGGLTSPKAEWADCPGCPKCEPNDGLVLRKGRWRPTTAHTVVYLFSKGPEYFMDQLSMLEPTTGNASGGRGKRKANDRHIAGRNNVSWSEAAADRVELRNGRTVQSILKGQFSGADYALDDHYATYPEALPAWAIKGGTSERGNCPACGMPWVRKVKRERRLDGEENAGHGRSDTTWRSLGFRPSCSCNAGEPVPAVVLDPYGGAGTTELAARALGRKGISLEIYFSTCRLARRRVDVDLLAREHCVSPKDVVRDMERRRQLDGELVKRELAPISGPLFD